MIPEETLPVNRGRRFYFVHGNDDGTVDVYLWPKSGIDDTAILVVKHVQPFDGLEDDIRERYAAWCDSAEVITKGGENV